MTPGTSQANSRGCVVRANTFLGYVVEDPAALRLLAEIEVLSAGIIGRYVFRSPLVWSDELAGILFLWLPWSDPSLRSSAASRRG